MSKLESSMFIFVLIGCALLISFNSFRGSFYMAIHKALLLTFTVLIGACASLVQSTSVTGAYKKYELKEFERTLELITRAENAKNTTPEMRAELTYLKAQTHESLGQQKIAETLYEYLVEQHKDTQYGYLASKKLKTKI